MPQTPEWYPRAAAALAAGKSQQEVARECGTSVRTLRRALTARDGLLRGLTDQARAKAAQDTGEDIAALREKALAVLHQALDRGDVAAARALIAKLVAPAEAPQAEREREEEVSLVDAYREVALSLPAAADLAREGLIPPDLVERLRESCRAFLSDDLQCRPPIDCSAELVRPEGPADALELAKRGAGAPAPPAPPQAQQGQPGGPGSAVVERVATVIPIRPT